MKVGYILFSSSSECKENDINRLKSIGCDRIFVEQLEHEEKRPQWKKMLREVERNDEIVILCLKDAVRGLVQLASFFEFCRMNRIRVISLKDKFDSKDEMFQSSISQLMDAIGLFSGDIHPIKATTSRMKAAKKKKKTPFQKAKKKREILCVDLYNNGTSIEDIKEEIGIRSSSTIYGILKKYDAKINRRVNKTDSHK